MAIHPNKVRHRMENVGMDYLRVSFVNLSFLGVLDVHTSIFNFLTDYFDASSNHKDGKT